MRLNRVRLCGLMNVDEQFLSADAIRCPTIAHATSSGWMKREERNNVIQNQKQDTRRSERTLLYTIVGPDIPSLMSF